MKIFYVIVEDFIIVSSVYALSISVESDYVRAGFSREFLAGPQKEIETGSNHQLNNEYKGQIQGREVSG